MLVLCWKWGLGHSLTLLILALVMFLIQSAITNLQFSFAGRLVGLSMVCLGLRVLYLDLLKKSQHSVEDHSHHEAPVGSILFGLGVLHGTAGSAPILLLVPIALSKSLMSTMSYMFFFSFGMILTMGAYSFILNKITWTDKLASHLIKLRCITAVLTVAVGIRLMWEQ